MAEEKFPADEINFLSCGASVAEYVAAMKAAIAHGYFAMHPSGGYVTFTQAGAELFA